MIVVTGAGGFIGGHIARALSCTPALHRESNGVMQVDRLDRLAPSPYNLSPEQFLEWMEGTLEHPVKHYEVSAIVHMGACTDTMCGDWSYLTQTNVEYSCKIWNFCSWKSIRLIYASSGATYGDGTNGFSDDHAGIKALQPLNMYGWSKHLVDLYTTSHSTPGHGVPPAWAGLKFTNVYGPCEMHKGSMASMVYQILMQAEKNGKVRLFNYGEQSRDFVHIDDVISIVKFLLRASPSGIYNVGSGTSESFNTLTELAFEVLGKRRVVEYFEMPRDMEGVYQRHTHGDIAKLRALGYSDPSTSLRNGIRKLAQNLNLVKLAD